MIDDAGLEDEVKNLNTMPIHLGAFVLSYIKKFMNNFIHAINGFHTNDVCYTQIRRVYKFKINTGTNWKKLGWLEKVFYRGKAIRKTVHSSLVSSWLQK